MNQSNAAEVQLNPIEKLTKDIKQASKTLTKSEARFLVDSYYQIQEYRKAAFNQELSLEKSNEPHEVITWYANQSKNLENEIKKALDVYSMSNPVGRWARSVKGIGPVITAGLLAHIDIEKAPTAGHIWSYAGLIEGVAWLGGSAAESAIKNLVDQKQSISIEEVIKIANNFKCSPKWLARRVYRELTGMDIEFRNIGKEVPEQEYVNNLLEGKEITMQHIVKSLSMRPWNASLKVLCWKIGESFNKVCNIDDAFYGKILLDRKAYETAKNLQGEYADLAASILASKKIGKDTISYKAYIQGKLPDGHIHSRCKRYAVRMFLSHLHHVWYRYHFKKEPPKPFAIEILGHAHLVNVPGLDQVLREMEQV